MKKSISLLIVIAVLLISFGQAVAAEPSKTVKADLNNVSVSMNGKSMDTEIVNFEGRIYMPVKDACYYLGCDYQLDGKNNILQIVIGKGKSAKSSLNRKTTALGQDIAATVNPYNIRLNGIDTYLESLLYKGNVYVPVRYFAEIFNKKITWVSKTKNVNITDMPVTVIGAVNGTTISERDLTYIYNSTLNQIKNDPNNAGYQLTEEDKKGLKTQIFDQLVTSKILGQKVDENKITIEAKEIEDMNASIKKMVDYYQGIVNFRKVLAENDTYFNEVIKDMKAVFCANKLQNKLFKDVAASEDELKKYYEDNKQKFLQPETVSAKHILILTTDDKGESLDAAKKEEAKKKAEDILSKIKSGEDFDKLMNENSQDTGLKTNPDGYTFTKGEMVKEFEEAAFKMKVGEVSELVQTQYGYHIIKLEAKNPEKQYTYDEVKSDIKTQLDSQKKSDAYQKMLEKWKSESKVENKMK